MKKTKHIYCIVDMEKIHMIDEKDASYHVGVCERANVPQIMMEHVENMQIPDDMIGNRSMIKELIRQKLYEIFNKYDIWVVKK